MRGAPGRAPARQPGRPVKPKRPAARRRRWRRALAGLGLGLAAAAVAGYAALWAIPPLHRLALETVVTSGHSGLARFVATPAQLHRSLSAWLDTPDLQVLTAVQPGPAASAGVSVQPIRGAAWQGWMLLVPDPAWVHVAMTADVGRVGEQVSQFGAQAGAIAAVNGGGFQDAMGNGTGGLPVGVSASSGHFSDYPDLSGDYVIGFDGGGRLDVGKWTEAAAEAVGIRDAVSFKPLLVVDGQPEITSGDGGWGVAPRTAIGQRADGTVIFVVIDGRQPGSLGATLREVQDLMLAQGAVTAVNLDGGSSTTLWYRGHVVNNPCCSPNGERYIATAFLISPPA